MCVSIDMSEPLLAAGSEVFTTHGQRCCRGLFGEVNIIVSLGNSLLVDEPDQRRKL
jgi:hypothetical protein